MWRLFAYPQRVLPTNLRTYVVGVPNACNLCHLDKTQLRELDAVARLWKLPEVPRGAHKAIPDIPAGEF